MPEEHSELEQLGREAHSTLRMLGSVISMAWRNLLANKLRSALTVLGLFIGIAGVIAIVGAGEGVKAYFRSAISELGDNLLMVQPQAAREEGRLIQQAEPFEIDDLEFLANNATTISSVEGNAQSEETVKFRNTTRSYTVYGREEAGLSISQLELARGRWISRADVQGRARVAVLGSQVADELFPANLAPVGNSIKISGADFRVIGVLEAKGRIGGAPNWDQNVQVPLTSYHSRIAGNKEIGWIHLLVKQPDELGASGSEEAMRMAQQEVTRLLRIRRNISDPTKDDFVLITPEDFLEFGSTIINVMVTIFAVVAMVALVVGSIGVMNIMLVSVKERTREIGLRKALGAPARVIMAQFLLESVFISLLGGLIGFLAGYAGAFGLNALLTSLGVFGSEPIQTVVPWNYVAITVGVAVLVGLAAGVWPAVQAARMDPIEALRYE